MLKSQARKIFIQKRKDALPQQRMKWDDLVLIQFDKLGLPEIDVLFSYSPMETEVNADPIVDYLYYRNPDMELAYPVCNFDNNTMQAIKAEIDTPFVKNLYGIPEPESDEIIHPELIDIILIPLLCFDEDGYRVGYGKGFYDKYLQHVRNDTIKIGLSYFEPVKMIEDRNKFDLPLDYCVTPERTYAF